MIRAPFRRLGWPLWAGLLTLVLLPTGLAAALSLTEYDGLGAPRFVGPANFLALASDPLVYTALLNSLYLVALVVPVRLTVALGLALLLARRAKRSVAAASVVFLPVTIPDTAHALLWAFLLNPLFGPLAEVLRAFGVPAAGFLLGEWGSRLSIALVVAYQLGELFLILLAVRREVPRELYEVCAVEGASGWFSFANVTFPLIAPALGILAARDVAWSLQASFVPALVITQGGPVYATTFLPGAIYGAGFEFLRFGYASALTVLLVTVTTALMAVALWLFSADTARPR